MENPRKYSVTTYEVPGRDQRADTNGLIANDILCRLWQELALDDLLVVHLERRLSIVPESSRDIVDVLLTLSHSLARVVRLQLRQEGLVSLEEIGRLGQESDSVSASKTWPLGAVEETLGRLDGSLGVLCGGLVDVGEDGGVRGVNDLAGLAVRGVTPLAVDEESWLGSLL